MSQKDISELRPWRRGTVIVLTAVAMVTLLLCATFAIDVGYICALTAEQQNNADAAALSGAIALQDELSESVIEHVRDVLARNQQSQGYLSLDDQIIEVGWWDSVNLAFYPLDSSEWAKRAFAVRVRALRSGARLFFAPLLGRSQTDVSREAVAIGSRACRGIWGIEGVRIPGNVVTDSYNYDPTQPYAPENAGAEGDVCSGQGVRAMGSFEINGDVMTGLGYEVDVSGSAGAITGITTSSMQGMTAPTVDLGDAATNNDNATIGLTDRGLSPFTSGWNMVVRSQDNLTLQAGTYYLDSITMRAGASVTITGPTTIYVTGDINATGTGFVNTTQDPHDLSIICLATSVELNGTSDFFGSVLAPNADVILSGTSDYYGAVVGGTVEMRGDFQFHVEESLPILDLIQPPHPILVL